MAIIIKRKIYTLDATNIPLGRLAVKAVAILRGKGKTDFKPNLDAGDFVVVKNFKKVKITGKKLKQKIYYRHSGYPGGFKQTLMEKIFQETPGKILEMAVWGMLPKNKLRNQQIKRLKIEL